MTGAVELARLFGLSERVIGLTIVAAGTSLPEVVTSVVSTVRGRADVAIGNVIGSNLFNILGILGLAALVTPLPVHPLIVARDNWWMLGTTLALFPLMFTGFRITRMEGGLLLGGYGDVSLVPAGLASHVECAPNRASPARRRCSRCSARPGASRPACPGPFARWHRRRGC